MHLFRQPAPPSSSFARSARWAALVGAILVLPVVFFVPPAKAFDHPIVFAELVVGLLVFFVILPCLLAAHLSNLKFRRELSKTYRMRPPKQRFG
jgi:protein-S-isoprenylcysteine O-methyltransferase Ste14